MDCILHKDVLHTSRIEIYKRMNDTLIFLYLVIACSVWLWLQIKFTATITVPQQALILLATILWPGTLAIALGRLITGERPWE